MPATPDSTKRWLVGVEPVRDLVPRPEPAVEERALARVRVEAVRPSHGRGGRLRRPVQAPGEVERGIADARVAPVDDARDPPVAHEHVLGPEVRVQERGLEVELRDAGEESLRALPLRRRQ